jgi:hypothetical protein
MPYCPPMSKMLKVGPWLLLGALLAGCTSTITNLTPSKQARNATGMYPVEVAWDSREQVVRPETLTPYVVVEFESYKMRPTLGMKNRWEVLIPVPADKNMVPYQFRVDYEYNSYGKPKPSSKLSQSYKLEITDK